MSKIIGIPTHDSMMNPVITAIQELGGSGTIEEIDNRTIEIMHLPNTILEIPHGRGSKSEIEYRLAWTRTYLKKFGLLENSSRGIWSIVNDKKDIKQVDPKEVVKYVHEIGKEEKEDKKDEVIDEEVPEEFQNWKEKLLDILSKIDPSAFERLIQRLLRESGFYQVEVTGKTGDGGIDGKGIFRIGGLISFNVLFQCKRWTTKPVTPSDIRDFRGALQGRADKGLFVTIGSYTRDAVKEASRDGATPIDILDGNALVDKLKELKLGIKTEFVEKVDIDENWYSKI